MLAALSLGRRSMGLAAPNPSVGALVVRDGVVHGRGVTAPGGRPHAEPIALAEAGEGARGATLYVTLEPCSHHGRTPPCVDAVLASGVAQVVVAIRDPDPRVAGRGISRLRDAGIDVIEDVARVAAHRDHLGHFLHVTRGRPMVTVKMAETADGFAARPVGAARLLITGPAANGRVQMMRATHDAILVGGGTACEDDPLLTVRVPGMEEVSPRRIVLDTRLSLSLASRLVDTADTAPTMVFTGADAAEDRAAALAGRGIEIARAVTGQDGGLDLPTVLADLGRRGLTRVFCEGGPRLASMLILQDLADVVVLFTSDTALGGPGRPALSLAARARIADSDTYILREDGRVGPDRMLIYDRREALCSPGS